MPTALRRLILTLLIGGALVGLFYTGRIAVTGTDSTSGNLPETVDRLMPVSGGNVPRQSPVGIDVADGHDAYLVINGIEVRDASDGVMRDLGTGLIRFQPGPGLPIESLEDGDNCILAYVWDRLEGEATAQPVSWCFTAY